MGQEKLFMSDDAVLHVCYCWGWGRTETKTKVCLPHADSDEEFIRRFGEEVPWRLEEFKPELIYRICGLDTHRDSYGTRKLTERCYRACEDKGAAEDVCEGRLIVKIGCNRAAGDVRVRDAENRGPPRGAKWVQGLKSLTCTS